MVGPKREAAGFRRSRVNAYQWGFGLVEAHGLALPSELGCPG